MKVLVHRRAIDPGQKPFDLETTISLPVNEPAPLKKLTFAHSEMASDAANSSLAFRPFGGQSEHK